LSIHKLPLDNDAGLHEEEDRHKVFVHHAHLPCLHLYSFSRLVQQHAGGRPKATEGVAPDQFHEKRIRTSPERGEIKVATSTCRPEREPGAPARTPASAGRLPTTPATRSSTSAIHPQEAEIANQQKKISANQNTEVRSERGRRRRKLVGDGIRAWTQLGTSTTPRPCPGCCSNNPMPSSRAARSPPPSAAGCCNDARRRHNPACHRCAQQRLCGVGRENA
jgi:hypothetical protein